MSGVYREQLDRLWGWRFTNQIIDEASEAFDTREPSTQQILAVAVGQILSSKHVVPCDKCGSVKDLHHCDASEDV